MPTNLNVALDLLKAEYDEVRNMKDVRDRWVRFYLLIVGGPLAFLSAYVTTSTGQLRVNASRPVILASGALFSLVGVIFMLLYIRQRINVISTYRRIAILRDQLILDHLDASAEVTRELIARPKRYQYSADHLSLALYVCLNAIWLTIGALCLLAMYTSAARFYPIYALAMFTVIVCGQTIICRRYLASVEEELYAETALIGASSDATNGVQCAPAPPDGAGDVAP